jgi:hypothetical protein
MTVTCFDPRRLRIVNCVTTLDTLSDRPGLPPGGIGRRSTTPLGGRAGDLICHAEDGAIEGDAVREALTQFDPLWDELFPAEQARIVALSVARVEIGLDGLDVKLRVDGPAGLADELRAAA